MELKKRSLIFCLWQGGGRVAHGKTKNRKARGWKEENGIFFGRRSLNIKDLNRRKRRKTTKREEEKSRLAQKEKKR